MTWKYILSVACLSLLTLLAACAEAEQDVATEQDPATDQMQTETGENGLAQRENIPPESLEAGDIASEEMREQRMEREFETVTVLQRELTGNYRSDSLRAIVDFEGRRYTGPTTTGQDVQDAELTIVDEGDDYVRFVVGEADTIAVRMQGEDRIVLTLAEDDRASAMTMQREQ
jgi:hypothetical protein